MARPPKSRGREPQRSEERAATVTRIEPATAARAVAPPLRALDDVLVGRAAELEALGRAFDAGQRLVTVWGPPGVGKSRLAEAFVAARAGEACVLQLGDVESGAELLQILEGEPALRDAASDALVVLDDLEQVQGAAAAMTRALRAHPRRRWLVTTRWRLRLRAEQVVELHPLALPGDRSDLDAESTQLLLARARTTPAQLAERGGEAEAAIELALRLQGIPLALELAAEQVELLGFAGLLQRLTAGRPGALLELLRSHASDAPARHADLRAALDRSWQLLPEAQRELLALCSIFRGPFSIEAAEAVAGGDALAGLHGLRDHALLQLDADGRVVPLWSVAAHAGERLRALPQALQHAAHRRHRDHYQERARRVGPGDVLDDEVWENLLAVAERAAGGDAPAALADAAEALVLLARSAKARGATPELLGTLQRVLAGGDSVELAARARLHALHGALLSMGARADDAIAALDEATRLAAAAGDAELEAEVQADLGVLHHGRRRMPEAAACYARAMRQLGEGGPLPLRIRVVGNLGALHHDLREFDVAQAHYRDAVELLARAPDIRLEGAMLGNMGVLEQEQGNHDAALGSYGRAVELLERAGDRRLCAITRGNLGALLHERGEHGRARALYRLALEELTDVGDLRSELLARVRLAAVHARLQDVTSAQRQLQRVDALVARVGDGIGAALADLARGFVEGAHAHAAAAAGEAEEAAAHLQRAQVRIERHRNADAAQAPVELSDDLRFLLRLLSIDLQPLGLSLSEPSLDALVVAADARFYRPPRGPWQDLRRHHVLRRILAALVARHGEAPGSGLSLDDLQAIAWPSERIRPDAAANRIYVAIAKLRKGGLKAQLERDEGGYFLHPGVRVVRGEPLGDQRAAPGDGD